MQITINTAEILGDEDSIRDEVIQEVRNALLQSLRKEASAQLAKAVSESIQEAVNGAVESAITVAIDTPFTDVDEYGRVGKTETIRDRIAGHIEKQCVFKNMQYASDQNVFTKAVNATVEKEVAKFKTEYMSLVNRRVVEETMAMAVTKLKESMGIK